MSFQHHGTTAAFLFFVILSVMRAGTSNAAFHHSSLFSFHVQQSYATTSRSVSDHFLLTTSAASSRRGHNAMVSFAQKNKKKKLTGGRDSDGNTLIAVNRVARRNYEVLETMEAGISLLGTEVKAIRDKGKLNLRDGYVRPTKNGKSCILYNVHISQHSTAGPYFQHEEKRPRSLLVHKQEARKLLQKTELQGLTIVPLKAYFNDKNKVKIEIALCRGKNVRDKRADIKERDASREARRMILQSFQL